MSHWNWNVPRQDGAWHRGGSLLRIIALLAPWISVLLLILLFRLMDGALLISRGTVFDLPNGDMQEGEVSDLVAIAIPMPKINRTLVYFDDARYFADDSVSMEKFAKQLAERINRSERKCLLIMADRQVSGGDLMNLVSVARRSGAEKVMFAERHLEDRP